MNRLPMQQLQPFQHRAVPLREEPLGDMQAVVRIDPDQVRVERGVVGLGQRQAVRDNGLPEALGFVRDDVGGVEQPRLGQSGDGVACARSMFGSFAERPTAPMPYNCPMSRTAL